MHNMTPNLAPLPPVGLAAKQRPLAGLQNNQNLLRCHMLRVWRSSCNIKKTKDSCS
ncbi:hypothetical protein U1Q18_022979, partial [Sarracenia purpurea var. burkii]